MVPEQVEGPLIIPDPNPLCLRNHVSCNPHKMETVATTNQEDELGTAS